MGNHGKDHPSTNNVTIDKTIKSTKMKDMDPYGWMMAALAMTIIFTALFLLYVIFKYVGKFNIRQGKKRVAAKAGKDSSEVQYGELPGETYAAIAMALYLYKGQAESHDEESYVMTSSTPTVILTMELQDIRPTPGLSTQKK